MQGSSALPRLATGTAVGLSFLVTLTLGLPAHAIEEIPLATNTLSQSTDGAGVSAVALEGGGFAALWLVLGFPDSELQMQWLDKNGEILFEEGGRTIAGNGVGNTTMVANPDGGVFVAFGGSFGNPVGMRVQSFDATGDPRWPGVGVVVSTLADFQVTPTLVPDSSGGVYVCFALQTDLEIWCQHLDAAGNLLWSPEGIEAGGIPGTRIRPLGVADGSGGLLVFWRNLRDSTDQQIDFIRMEGQHFDSAGSRLWGEGLLVRDTLLEEGEFFELDSYAVIGDGAGGAVVTFEARRDLKTENRGIVAQRVAGDGTLLWRNGITVVDDVPSTQHRAAVQPHDGGVIVVSSETINEVTTRLRIFRLDANGQHRWPEEGLLLSDPSSTGANINPRGSFDRGVLRVAWTTQLPDEIFEMDILLARYDQDGARLEPASETVTSAPIAQFCSALVFSEATDKFFILWDDSRSNNFENGDIYAAEVPAAFLGDMIFADGFELGDTSGWSAVNP